jgi:hypothetical protein
VALSADGTTALIGGGGDNDGAGAAWIFKRSRSTWSQSGSKLTPTGERAPRSFGTALALSADAGTAAIAGVGDDGAGATWIFTRTGSTWTQTAKLTPNDATGKSAFGVRLALSDDGTTLIIGGNQDAGGIGAAWVFVRSGSTWTQQGPKLTANDQQGAANLGIRVALAGDGRTALIGGWNDDHGLGAAWVFTRTGSTWTQQGQKLTANDERGAGTFGGGVALSEDGGTALIGGEQDNNDLGAAWIFTRTGSRWSQHGSKLVGSGETGNGWFGKTVALSADGKLALIGGHVDNAEIGAAWVFTRTGTAWIQQGPKLTGSGEIGAGAFGFKLALSADGNTALIGGTDDNQSVGAVWVFANPASASRFVATAAATAVRSVAPIVSVTRHGGLCVSGSECRSTLRIDDRTISGDGYASRRLKPSERAALLRAVRTLDARYLRAHPFAGTCPIAYDGNESIYRFRGFPRALASCTYDLRGVEAVRLAERLLGTLRPTRR